MGLPHPHSAAPAHDSSRFEVYFGADGGSSGVHSGPSWGELGSLRGRSWVHLGGSAVGLGSLGIPLGPIFARLGVQWTPLWGPSRVDLGPAWGPSVGRSGGDLGAISGGSGLRLGAIWGPSWAEIASSWGRCGCSNRQPAGPPTELPPPPPPPAEAMSCAGRTAMAVVDEFGELCGPLRMCVWGRLGVRSWACVREGGVAWVCLEGAQADLDRRSFTGFVHSRQRPPRSSMSRRSAPRGPAQGSSLRGIPFSSAPRFAEEPILEVLKHSGSPHRDLENRLRSETRSRKNIKSLQSEHCAPFSRATNRRPFRDPPDTPNRLRDAASASPRPAWRASGGLWAKLAKTWPTLGQLGQTGQAKGGPASEMLAQSWPSSAKVGQLWSMLSSTFVKVGRNHSYVGLHRPTPASSCRVWPNLVATSRQLLGRISTCWTTSELAGVSGGDLSRSSGERLFHNFRVAQLLLP